MIDSNSEINTIGTNSFSSTKKAGIFITSLLCLNDVPGTSPALSDTCLTNVGNYSLDNELSTSSGLNFEKIQECTVQRLFEFRRISGLTWEKISELFGVTRRSVHFWANGKPMEDERSEKLFQLLTYIRKLDTGYASENRRLLSSKDESGISLFDLFKKDDFYSANLRIPSSAVPKLHRRPIRPLSKKGREELGLDLPISPFDLLEADNRYIPDKSRKVSRVQVKKLSKS